MVFFMVFLLCQIPKLSFYKTKINIFNNSVNSDFMVKNSFWILQPGKRLSLIYSASNYNSFVISIFLILNKMSYLFFLSVYFFSFLFIIIVKPR